MKHPIGTNSLKRAEIVKHIFSSLGDAGFNRYKGASIYRDKGLQTQIEFATRHVDAAHITRFDDIISFDGAKPAPVSSFENWNFFGLWNIAGRQGPYAFNDGTTWEDTDLAKDMEYTIPSFFKQINSYESAYDFFTSDGGTFGGHEVVISDRGNIPRRDAILEAYRLAALRNDTARVNYSLELLMKYKESSSRASQAVDVLFEMYPALSNLVANGSR